MNGQSWTSFSCFRRPQKALDLLVQESLPATLVCLQKVVLGTELTCLTEKPIHQQRYWAPQDGGLLGRKGILLGHLQPVELWKDCYVVDVAFFPPKICTCGPMTSS